MLNNISSASGCCFLSMELQSMSRYYNNAYLVNAYDKRIIKVELNKSMFLALLLAGS